MTENRRKPARGRRRAPTRRAGQRGSAGVRANPGVIIAIVAAGVLLLAVLVCVLWFVVFRKSAGKDTPTVEMTEPILSVDESSLSAHEFYRQNSEKLIDVQDAGTYEGNLTEAKVAELAEARGFTQAPLTYRFDISGEYVGETETAGAADNTVPLYTTTYVTDAGGVWCIDVIGGAVFARPVSYRFYAYDQPEVILAEKEELVCYDENTNQFYFTVPKDSVVRMITVSEINADTLSKFTREEMEQS